MGINRSDHSYPPHNKRLGRYPLSREVSGSGIAVLASCALIPIWIEIVWALIVPLSDNQAVQLLKARRSSAVCSRRRELGA